MDQKCQPLKYFSDNANLFKITRGTIEIWNENILRPTSVTGNKARTQQPATETPSQEGVGVKLSNMQYGTDHLALSSCFA